MPGLRKLLESADLTAGELSQNRQNERKKNDHRYLAWPVKDHLRVERRYSSEPASYTKFVDCWLPQNDRSDDSESESSIHEGFENLRRLPASRHVLAASSLTLPPTPPIFDNSDVTKSSEAPPTQPLPAGVDKATLGWSRSLPGTVEGDPSDPLTPQISPPSSPASPVNLSGSPNYLELRLLRPFDAQGQDSSLGLNHFPSSHADSFKTALEDLATVTPSAKGSPAPASAAAERDFPRKTPTPSEAALNAAKPRLAGIGAEDWARSNDQRLGRPLDKKSLSSEDSFTDLDKHISYVSGPEELDDLVASPPTGSENDQGQLVHPLTSTSPALLDGKLPLTADVNDLIYRHVREQGTQRHSGVSSTSGAIIAGILISDVDTTPKRLKRRSKCPSLREGSSSGQGSTNESPRDASNTALFRSAASEDSPVAMNSLRQVSAPPHLGADMSPITAFTYSSLQEPLAQPPRGVVISRKQLGPQLRDQSRSLTSPMVQTTAVRTLRHFSPGERLSNNSSVRRTSLEATLRDHNEDTSAGKAGTSSPATREGRVTKNMAIKRGEPVKNDTEDGQQRKSSRKPYDRNVFTPIASRSTDADSQRPQSSKSIRRFSRDERLENNSIRRTSWTPGFAAPTFGSDVFTQGTTRDHYRDKKGDGIQPAPDALNDAHSRSASTEHKSGFHSPRKGLDVRQLQPLSTPASISQFSDNTDVSVREANGVRIYSHKGASIHEVDVPQTSRPNSKDEPSVAVGPLSPRDRVGGPATRFKRPAFNAQIEPPTPVRDTMTPVPHMDSPLTNPRDAPQPPTFNFISPTPDIDRPNSAYANGSNTMEEGVTSAMPQRRPSLLQKAKKYSEGLLVRTGSLRRPRRAAEQDCAERAHHLSPMWRPEGFWDETDDSEDDGDFEAGGTRLPPGGDTSDVPGNGENTKGKSFPRRMSRRIPGFRGTGGFLVGNSIGKDRHGTNNRRHYISTRTPTGNKEENQEPVRRLKSYSSSQNSLGHASSARRSMAVPLPGGKGTKWSPAQRFRAHMQNMRLQLDERALEKRRRELRNRIGKKVVHDGQM